MRALLQALTEHSQHAELIDSLTHLARLKIIFHRLALLPNPLT